MLSAVAEALALLLSASEEAAKGKHLCGHRAVPLRAVRRQEPVSAAHVLRMTVPALIGKFHNQSFSITV